MTIRQTHKIKIPTEKIKNENETTKKMGHRKSPGPGWCITHFFDIFVFFNTFFEIFFVFTNQK